MCTAEVSTQLVDAKLTKSSPLKGNAPKAVNVTPPTLLRGTTSITSPLSPGSAARVLSNMRNSTSPRPSIHMSPRREVMRTGSPGSDHSKDRNKAILSFDAHLKSIITTALMADGEKKHSEGEDVNKSSCSIEAEQLTFKNHLSHDRQQSLHAGTLQTKQPKRELEVTVTQHIPVQIPLNDSGGCKKPCMQVSIPLSNVHKEAGSKKQVTKLKALPHVICEGYSPISRPSSSSSTESAESVKNLEHGAHISCTKHGSCLSPATSVAHDMPLPSKSPVSVAPTLAAKPDEKGGVSMPSLLHRTPPPPHVLRMYPSYAAMLGFSGAAPGTLPMLNSFSMPNLPMSMQMLYNFGGLNGVSKLPDQQLQQKSSPKHQQSSAIGLDKPKRTRRKRCSPNSSTDMVTSKKQTSTVLSVPIVAPNASSQPLVVSATSDTCITSSTICSLSTTTTTMAECSSAVGQDARMFFGEFILINGFVILYSVTHIVCILFSMTISITQLSANTIFWH